MIHRGKVRGGSIWIAAAVLLVVYAMQAQACPLPVFRYALEHWVSSPVEISVLCQGTPPPEQQQTMTDVLRQSHAPDFSFVGMVDINMPPPSPADPPPMKTWIDLGRPPLPVIVLRRRAPDSRASATTTYLPLRMEYLQQLAMSPERSEMVRRLLAGDSIVWVLLQSGDVAKDKAARALLDAALRQVQEKNRLPSEAELDADERRPGWPGAGHAGAGAVPFKLQFGVVELPGQGLEAELLRGMLRPVATTLPDHAAPAVFPVFGRARALTVLWDDTLTATNIMAACDFLCGGCSCIVKAANPGVELVVDTDWNAALSKAAGEPGPVATSEASAATEPTLPSFVGVPPTNAPIAALSVSVPPPNVGAPKAPRLHLAQSLAITLGASVLAMLFATFWILRRSGRN